MYKVFVQNKPIIFVSRDKVLSEGSRIQEFNNLKGKHIETVVQLLYEDSDEPVYVRAEDPEDAMNWCFRGYERVDAAGGVVRVEGHYLSIIRFGIPDLPKGKVEPDEDMHEAARREIAEECGFICTNRGRFIAETRHTYAFKGKAVLKTTWWYYFDERQTRLLETKLVPQIEEDISEVRWLPLTYFEKMRQETYPSLVDVIDAALVLR